MTTHRLTLRPAAVAIAVVLLSALSIAVWALGGHHSRWWLPFGIAFGVGAHVMLARGLKAVLGAMTPLASGAPEAGSYSRSVYGTPGRATLEVAGLGVVAGVLFGVGATLGHGGVGLLAVLALLAALALDLHRWERVATSADYVWFQRGFGQKVHQVAIDNIRDISISERDDNGFTLRHMTRNRVCRLNLRMADKRLVALPKTDAHTDLDAVETVANHIRTRQQLAAELSSRQNPKGPSTASAPVDDKALRRELRRLRAKPAVADAAGEAPDTSPTRPL